MGIQTTLETLTTTQTSRTGISAERINSSINAGVSANILAAQIQENLDKHGVKLTITPQDVAGANKLFIANKSGPAITKEQAKNLIANQQQLDGALPSGA